MATNVVTMKYPTEAAWATMSELKSIDPESVRITGKAAEIVKSQTEHRREADECIKAVKGIDLDIAALMRKRFLVAGDLRRAVNAAVKAAFEMTYAQAEKLADEFEEHGFTKAVKTAVRRVRDMLFDDSKKCYRDTVCVEIACRRDSENCSLDFDFEYVPTGNCFRISIPVCDLAHEICRKKRRQWDDLMLIDVSFPMSSSDECVLICHYDVRVIRKQLDNFMARGCLPVKEALSNNTTRFYDRGVFEDFYDEPYVMNENDYYQEAYS